MELGEVTLEQLHKIECKVVEDLQLEAFSEMGHGTFLDFVLTESKVKEVSKMMFSSVCFAGLFV